MFKQQKNVEYLDAAAMRMFIVFPTFIFAIVSLINFVLNNKNLDVNIISRARSILTIVSFHI
jgi:hypothetical protein